VLTGDALIARFAAVGVDVKPADAIERRIRRPYAHDTRAGAMRTQSVWLQSGWRTIASAIGSDLKCSLPISVSRGVSIAAFPKVGLISIIARARRSGSVSLLVQVTHGT